MTNVLVCVKRVPDVSGEVLLTDDKQSVDARFVGFTTSDHEQCAVEIAVQVSAATDGTATVVSVGAPESVEQIRCRARCRVHGGGARRGRPGDAGSRRRRPRDRSGRRRTHDLVLLGNDAADSGDFQVPVRLAEELGWPVVTGIKTVDVADGVAHCRGDGPLGTETFEVPLPAVISVLEGGVEPRYPTITGRMKAKKVEVETRPLSRPATGSSRVTMTLPETASSSAALLGEGPGAAPAVVDLFEKLGVAR